MGWLDWLRGKPAPASTLEPEGPPTTASGVLAPCTDTAGVTVHVGHGTHGTYDLGGAVTTMGGDEVLRFVLNDDLLEEVMYNGSDRPLVVFHRTHGMCDVNYKVELAVVHRFIGEVAQANDKVLDAAHPFLDGSLPDGSRINIAIPPVSGTWPSFTIRKFRKSTITVPDLVRYGAITPEAGAFLWLAIEGLGFLAANVLVVGGTGSGKTTLLNALSHLAPMTHRVVVIEDTRELRIAHPNVVRMATAENVSMDALLINALRQRPDRLLVGEVRGPEARTLFTAMNTGHDGCMGTLHANSARESTLRITSPPMNVPLSQVAALDLIVVQHRKSTESGTRRYCAEITEVSGYGGEQIRLNQLFVWDEFKRVLVPTGVPSRLRTRISQAAGLGVPEVTEILKRREAILTELAKDKKDEAGVLDGLAAEHARSRR